jgi:hypothetical protein
MDMDDDFDWNSVARQTEEISQCWFEKLQRLDWVKESMTSWNIIR